MKRKFCKFCYDVGLSIRHIADSKKIQSLLHLFHHMHHEDGEHEIHHCGGKHPKSKYTIKHCKHDKHMIDKEEAIGHATDEDLMPIEVNIKFKEECSEGGWHIESGDKIKD